MRSIVQFDDCTLWLSVVVHGEKHEKFSIYTLSKYTIKAEYNIVVRQIYLYAIME